MVPPVFDEEELERNGSEQNGRYTIPDKRGRTVKFVLHTERMAPLPPPPDGERNWGRPPDAEQGPNGEPGRDERQDWAARRQGRMVIIRQDFRFFNTLASGKYYYIDIFHPAYWRTITVMNVLLPVSCLLLLVLVFYIRSLYVRNREYQERIDSQKNLVVLGSAASTLAHEIKNPLHSIRLQTEILEKIFANSEPSAETGREELGIINEEVDRLSALSYRINDYIRDAAGEPVTVNSYTVLEEICPRLCGRNSITAESVKVGMIFVVPDRLRSVFENLLRNALESGGDSEEVGASIARGGGNIIITVFDRGKGIAAEDLKRVFDPFFTRKSTGTGIGLGISRRFVEAARGTITLENRDGGGAAARITLPEHGLNLPHKSRYD
jgi:two-component system sensor histidine kinase HydH